jgi:prepilin-type N-terminal cleavage/methylation domain-containing protein
MSRAFTLIELLIVIALISLLSTAAIVAINPLELMRRSQDAKVYEFISEIYKVLSVKERFSQDYDAEPLSSSVSTVLIDKLVEIGELKNHVKNHEYLAKIYLSVKKTGDELALCFRPSSVSFVNDLDKTHYSSDGIINDTCTPNCYTCLSSRVDTPSPATTPAAQYASEPTPTPITNYQAEPTPTPANSCPISSDYPQLPTFSFFRSDKFSQYGCNGFQVIDYSCSSYVWETWNNIEPCKSLCSPGQRCLMKRFLHVPLDLFNPLYKSCNDHWLDAREFYCVDEPYANCAGYPYPSSDIQFVYGCSDPGRAIDWKPQYR